MSPANSYQTGTKFNSFLEMDGKITYPSEFPSLEVGSKTYTYDENGMTQGTYSIRWNTVVVEDGANKGRNNWNPEVSSNIKTYHVDGTIILNETDKYTVMFACQYPNSDKFEVLTKYAYRVETGYQESALTQPNMEPISGYRFDGWYCDEACNQKAEFNGTVTKNVTYYGKYVRETYTIDYVLNEGTLSSENPTTYTYGVGVQNFADATKSGFTFGGWYSDPEFKSKVESISTTDTGNKTLYAHWTEDTTAKPTTTDVYVYFKMVDAAGNNISRDKINNEDLKKTVYNKEAGGATWATLGKIASAETLTDGTGYKGTNTTLVTVGNEAKNQLKDNALYKKNKGIATTVLANIEWFQLKQCAGATDYVSDGSRWHLDGKITGYTVTYNKGTTDSVDKMPVADEVVYYLSGSDYTVSDATPTRDGYVFTGWKSDNNVYASKSKMNMPAKNVVLTAQWEVDNWKDGDSKTPTDKDSETGGDGIPDCYQVLVNYKSGDLDKGKIADTARTQEVLTIKNTAGEWASTGTVKASGSTATATGNRCYFSKWTTNADVDTSKEPAKLGQQTFTAEGGKTYTFTANFERSSGGGSGGSNRPKPPVVEIPDDVPTGLNGKDHYAYIIGYGNNDVRPQNNITRAEVATIFFRLLTDETREANMTKSNGYNDVKDGDWFCCAVSTLSKMGIIKGYEDGSFKPNDPISRAEFAAIAARFDPDGDKTPATFADVTSHWAKDEISIAANHGWIKGYEDGSFKPDQKITRAETMTLVNRVLNRLPETKDDLHKDMKTWVDNMDETAWYYLAVQEATNSHYFKNKTGTKFEQWTDLRDTRDWSELEK